MERSEVIGNIIRVSIVAAALITGCGAAALDARAAVIGTALEVGPDARGPSEAIDASGQLGRRGLGDRSQIIYVDDDNTSGPWDGSIEHPYQYIQDGINHAAAGDTVFVLAGEYLENLIVDRSVILTGEDRDTTVIDARGLAAAVYISAANVTLSGFTITDGAGSAAVVLVSDGNTVSNNHITNSPAPRWAAVLLSYSWNNEICGNHITYTDRQAAIWLNGACGNTISGNTCSDNGFTGVTLWLGSDNNTISNNTFMNSRNGVSFSESSHNTLTGNVFGNNTFDGVHASECSDLVITDNVFTAGGGIEFDVYDDPEFWTTHTIQGNTIDGRPIYYFHGETGVVVPADAAQAILADCQDCSVSGLVCHDSIVPIQLGFCTSCAVMNNTVTVEWYSDGIGLGSCDGITVVGNDIRSTYDQYEEDPAVNIAAVKVLDGGQNTYGSNVIRGFNQGILIRRWNDSYGNVIAGNDIASKLIGIWLIEHGGDGTGVLVSGNTFTDCPLGALSIGRWRGVTAVENVMNGCSLVISGEALEHWNTHTIEGNTVNGEELVYRANEDDFAITGDAGQVVLANCYNFGVAGLELDSVSSGVVGGFCSHGRVADSTFVNCGDSAIYFQMSDYIEVAQNQISGGGQGITFRGGEGNRINENRVMNAGKNGMWIFDCQGASVTGNVITETQATGIRCSGVGESEINRNAVRCGDSVGILLGSESDGNEVAGNAIARCDTYGIVLSYDSTDNLLHGNQSVENGTNAFEVDGTAGNLWYGPEGGNYWSDFEQNPGYPDYYEIAGDGTGVDWYPLESVFTCPFTPGDINGSCGPVDFDDFSTFAACWDVWPDDCGTYGCADVDGDGEMDLRDFAAFSLLFGD
ncbi:MAG: NosD domain-containing protein [Phycisphaerae bacterium]|jgi:parallel beta-helix repeat protein